MSLLSILLLNPTESLVRYGTNLWASLSYASYFMPIVSTSPPLPSSLPPPFSTLSLPPLAPSPSSTPFSTPSLLYLLLYPLLSLPSSLPPSLLNHLPLSPPSPLLLSPTPPLTYSLLPEAELVSFCALFSNFCFSLASTLSSFF